MTRERVGELLEDLRWGSRRALGRLGPDGRRSEEARRVFRRRRLAGLVVIVLALVAVFRFVPLPGLSCKTSPAKTCVPADHAIDLVPASADAYLHVNLNPDSSQYSLAKDLGDSLPHTRQIVQSLFDSLGLGLRLNLATDVAPWVGDEAAIAELGGPRPQPLLLLAVKDRKGEGRFLAKLKPAQGVKAGKGTIQTYRGGLASADLAGFLALGRAPAVLAAIDTHRGREKALTESPAANALRESLPEQRLADAYLSPRAAGRLISGGGGLASQLDNFVDLQATDGLTLAVVAHGDGLEVQLQSALNPTASGKNPSFFGVFPTVRPSLAGEFPAGTLLYLDVANPVDTAPALLREVRSAAPSLYATLTRFGGRIRSAHIDLRRSVLPVLGGEGAIGVASGPSGPYLTVAFAGIDEARARDQIAGLQAPLVAALSAASTGQAPSLGAAQVGGTVVHSIHLTPTLTVAYAIFDGKLVASTYPAAVRGAVLGQDDLGGSDAFKAATSGASGGASALVFVNLEGLVKRADPLGLGQIVGSFGADLARLKALGVTVHSDSHNLKTTLFFNIQ